MTTRRLAYIAIGSSLILLALSSLFAHGADPDAKARAALALAMSKTTCKCGGPNDCTCTPDCQCVTCQNAKDAKLYADTYDAAVQTQRQVVFWIGDAYKEPLRVRLKQAMHCRLSNWFGYPRGVVVCRPVGKQLVIVQSWATVPSDEQLAAALSGPTPPPPGDLPVIRGGAECPTGH